MSIKKLEACAIVCDRCGKQYLKHDGSPYFANEDEAHEEINNQPDVYWEQLDGKLYCPDCYEYGEDEETVIPFPALRKCGDCDAYCECQLAGVKSGDDACDNFDDTSLSQMSK